MGGICRNSQWIKRSHDLVTIQVWSRCWLQIWFMMARSQNVIINDAVLREKAKQFGSELDVTDFQYSNGWLQRFKGRCGIQVICGEQCFCN